MAETQYLSTDPNAGKPAAAAVGGYLSTDPSAGTPEPEGESATSRFVGGVWKNLNPMGIVEAVKHPVDTLDAITDAITSNKEKARKAFKEGRYSEALGYAVASAIPVVGPAAANAGERIGEGDIAGGVGEGVGLVAPLAHAELGGAASAARGPVGRATSAVGRGSEALGKSGIARRVQTWGAGGAVASGKIVPAAAMAVGPEILKSGGRALQKVGEVIEGGKPELEVPSPAHLDRSVPVKAGSLTQEQLMERIKSGTGTPPPKPPKMSAIQPKSVAQAVSEVAQEAKDANVKPSIQEHLAAAKAVAEQGVAAKDALGAELAKRFNLPTDADVAVDVAAKNARVSEPRSQGHLLTNQKFRNEIGIAARRAGVTLTPELERAAYAMYGDGMSAADALSAARTAK